MAVVRGVKEKVHLPLYDAKTFTTDFHLSEQVSGNTIRFFVDVQNKTKLETNQQEAGVLSHFNTYEARALRVVVQPMNGGTYQEAAAEKQDTAAAKKQDAAAAKKLASGEQRNFISNFIYNSVTTFFVGEKIMIQAPTWMFPAGAGESNENRLSHGIASPEATFRFAEPVHIDSAQNFRVEIEFPRGIGRLLPSDTVNEETRVWVMIDGYITRDVQ